MKLLSKLTGLFKKRTVKTEEVKTEEVKETKETKSKLFPLSNLNFNDSFPVVIVSDSFRFYITTYDKVRNLNVTSYGLDNFTQPNFIFLHVDDVSEQTVIQRICRNEGNYSVEAVSFLGCTVIGICAALNSEVDENCRLRSQVERQPIFDVSSNLKDIVHTYTARIPNENTRRKISQYLIKRTTEVVSMFNKKQVFLVNINENKLFIIGRKKLLKEQALFISHIFTTTTMDLVGPIVVPVNVELENQAVCFVPDSDRLRHHSKYSFDIDDLLEDLDTGDVYCRSESEQNKLFMRDIIAIPYTVNQIARNKESVYPKFIERISNKNYYELPLGIEELRSEKPFYSHWFKNTLNQCKVAYRNQKEQIVLVDKFDDHYLLTMGSDGVNYEKLQGKRN